MLKDTAVLEPDANTSISGAVVTDASVTGTYKVHVLALWAIVKQSTSADSAGNHPMLSGAKFELLKDSNVCYKGESNSDGFVEWYKDGKKGLIKRDGKRYLYSSRSISTGRIRKE